ncbi:hypothetical protein [Microtetraspora malaysiensis]|uniref:Uncharacterized protein n=1 Tax=Microtetraspora malaysiensis TaxID=161358 RepID=A0ABW6SL20_9ACTN
MAFIEKTMRPLDPVVVGGRTCKRQIVLHKGADTGACLLANTRPEGPVGL